MTGPHNLKYHVTEKGSDRDVATLDNLLLKTLGISGDGIVHDGFPGDKYLLPFQQKYNKKHCLKPGDKGYLKEDGLIGDYDGIETGGMGTRQALIKEIQKMYNSENKVHIPEDGKMTPKLFSFALTHCAKIDEEHRAIFPDTRGYIPITDAQIEAAQRGAHKISQTGDKRSLQDACKITGSSFMWFSPSEAVEAVVLPKNNGERGGYNADNVDDGTYTRKPLIHGGAVSVGPEQAIEPGLGGKPQIKGQSKAILP